MSDPHEGGSTAGNFIHGIVEADNRAGTYDGRVCTRFPPEPNGFLHLGHAYATSVSYGIAKKYGGEFHLRFDDTNPAKESMEFVESQKRDLAWLGFEWGEHCYFASDYFGQMVTYAEQLIDAGKAYVCELDPEKIREYRGSFTQPGRNSPYRDRTVEENRRLFAAMQSGSMAEGSAVLRAKIDMAASNPVMRDPVMYRIVHKHHFRAGDRWHVYPTYDWAHCLEDSIEGITHSLCSIEFENNRELYDWYLIQLGVYRPKQIEFSKMALQDTIAGKRNLTRLVDEGKVMGWDDPRLVTIAGLRRRGYPPEAIHAFLRDLGVSKAPMSIDPTLLEHHLREDLNRRALRYMAVLRPLKLVIDNYPDDQVEMVEADNNPEDPDAGTRKMPFSKVLYIERDDFEIDPPKKYFRLAPDKEVRLKHAYFVRCVRHVVDEATGEVTEVHCVYDPETKGGSSPDGRKVKGTLHWVSAQHAVPAEVRLFDRLVLPAEPGDEREPMERLNPDSLRVLDGVRLEPALATSTPSEAVQFMRHGYFCADSVDSRPDAPLFNQTISLKDSWAKEKKKGG